MSRTAILIALAAAAIGLPAAAQTQQLPMASERIGQETPVQKKTPEQIAKEKAAKEKIRADAAKTSTSGVKSEADLIGQEMVAVKKTPEQLAKEKADKAKRGTTPEEQAKQAKTYGGS